MALGVLFVALVSIPAIIIVVRMSKPEANSAAPSQTSNQVQPEKPSRQVQAVGVGERSPLDTILDMEKFADAKEFASRTMSDSDGNPDDGAMLLALWGAKNLLWRDVGVPDETSVPKVLRDGARERGKRLCISGTVVQIITQDRVDSMWVGVLETPAANVVRFIAVRDVGRIVVDSPARFCGVTSGRNSYSNQSGGQTTAVTMVGMFDTPANRARK